VAATIPGAGPIGNFLAGWRGLARFWTVVLAVLGIGALVLELLGPPPNTAVTAAARTNPGAEPPAGGSSNGKAGNGEAGNGKAGSGKSRLAAQTIAPAGGPAAVPPGRPGRDTPGPITDPDPALLEPYPPEPDHKLPRIAMDGRTPMAVYAAGFDPSSVRPRVGLLVGGIGMSEADSLAAIKDLPGGVTLAISPYAADVGRLLDVARMNQHEFLLAIPMEPQGYPANDPDDRRALMTSLAPEENLNRLRWVLSRLGGYVGVTNSFGQMRGERLAGVPDQFTPVLEEVGHRGLLFVDARTNGARTNGAGANGAGTSGAGTSGAILPHAWNRSADTVIDADPIDTAVLDQRLDALTHMALDRGSALGIVLLPRPVTLARVAAWTNTLTSKGLALAPVSALVSPPAPAKQEAEK
jgi:polysaccharide deacetylase 2 family uncharacterized protein YibQ